LEQNQDKIDWDWLSANPNAIHLLEQNPDKINWYWLSLNPNAIHLLEKNPYKIDWYWLSKNTNAIHLLEQNQDKIDWDSLSQNPSIFYDSYDYAKIKEYCNIYKEELIQKRFHPKRVNYMLETYYNNDIEFYHSML
jgi:hypothetical protein